MNIRYTLLLSALVVLAGQANAARVDAGVHRTLRAQGTVNLIVTMQGKTDVTLEAFEPENYATRTDKINALKNQLQADNVASTSETIALLSQESGTATPLFTSYKNYWISNQVFIEAATIDLVQKLSALPSVRDVREEIVIDVEQPQYDNDPVEATIELVGYEWGVSKVQAPQVWADGNIGQGVLVGSIDTGVRGTHTALSRNFAGNYSWFDPENQLPEPYDGNGHGTHTMGTIAGAAGVGVAPGATWMTCKGCRTSQCPESDLLACGQFILCPTDTQGNNPDCSKAPRIVSNSWGGGQGEDWYSAVVDAWVKADIVPVFANGNNGPQCTTAHSPGDYPNVIGVGSTTSTDSLSSFSSKGPSVLGRMKPDISAPGQRVRSSWNTSDTDFATISGTSMATPHVTGAIALLLSAKPTLTIDDIKVLLYTTTDQTGLNATNFTCGGTSDAVWPNNQWGHGRLNVFNAYQGFRPAVTPVPTTAVPTPVPTTAVPTPVPTTAVPTAAPTPAPTPKNNRFCAGFYSKLGCNFWAWCYWDVAAKHCYGK